METWTNPSLSPDPKFFLFRLSRRPNSFLPEIGSQGRSNKHIRARMWEVLQPEFQSHRSNSRSKGCLWICGFICFNETPREAYAWAGWSSNKGSRATLEKGSPEIPRGNAPTAKRLLPGKSSWAKIKQIQQGGKRKGERKKKKKLRKETAALCAR